MIEVKNIEDVVNYQLCSGCGMCEAVEPKRFVMNDVEKFGYRPKLVENPDPTTGDAFKVCPGHQLTHTYDQGDGELDKSLEDCWGPVLGVWEGFASDEQIRFKGSSGGAATALSLYGLEQAGAANVLQTGRSAVAHLNESKVSEDRSDLIENSGSRYSPASPCTSIKEIDKAEGASVFVGKPCDVAAVKHWEDLDEKNKSKIAIRIGFFCAGTPSTEGNVALLKNQGLNVLERLQSLKFRGEGWPGNWKAVFSDREGRQSEPEMTYAQSWGFLSRFRQWRCYICPDHSGEFADIAVGDPWYREREPGEAGKSLIVVRTKRGLDYLMGAVDKNYITLESQNAELLPRSQPNLIEARGSIWARFLVLRTVGAPVLKLSGFKFFKFWLSSHSIKQKLASLYGTYVRVKRKNLKKNQQII